MTQSSTQVLMRNGGTALVITIAPTSLPEVLYWGQDLGPMTSPQLADFAHAHVPPVGSDVADVPPTMTLIPQQSQAWVGTPGLIGSRQGLSQFSAFATTAIRTIAAHGTDASPSSMIFDAHDAEAELDLSIELTLSGAGVVRVRATLTNIGAPGYQLDALNVALPTPPSETLVIDQNGHHLREHNTQTHEFTIGTHERATYIARGHNASTIHGTCEPGTAWQRGLAHYVHLAWSGNTRTIAERLVTAFQGMLAGEILLPGEVVLDAGQSYSTPWIVGTWGRGLDEAAGRMHGDLRSRPQHPSTPRPVTLNAWEAVYFDHSLPRLLALVEAAARVGVERFVLDDGWFGSRRDDTSGLGDWTVSEQVWPAGLAPLADAVHERGMEFGLWFEPEMVNPDSDLARAHSEWILSPRTHPSITARHQHVLDLTNPGAFDHVLAQMLAVLGSTRIDYIKWDFNRDLFESISPQTGLPAYHAQTLATYALMDAITAAHPTLEIESCAGGGGRIDLEILERAVRVWASDCSDPLERQGIEEGTGLLLPPELVGSHIASTTSHTTGRTLGMGLRASTALFSHLGIEWDLTAVSEAELDELTEWVKLHKELRPLLHSGTTVHADVADPSWKVRGVVSPRRDQAVFNIVHLHTSDQRPSPAMRLPGLDPQGTYRVTGLLPTGASRPIRPGSGRSPEWWDQGIELSGAELGVAGLRFPDLHPQQCALIDVRRV